MQDRTCDRCGRPAVVHETVIKQNEHHELHLCEHCARDEGYEINPTHTVLPILKHVIAAQVQLGPPRDVADNPAGKACTHCGRTFAEFRRSGLLGCANCYTQFASKLTSILAREHEGATHHVGKVPTRIACSISQPTDAGDEAGQNDETDTHGRIQAQLVEQARADRIALLTNQLKSAVRNEQYERAAALRDELTSLGVTMNPGE
ncbi:MAG: UvrB/UvrC motif-containing protein [Phycisphaeraceae bacterium]|nr:UvrB/UvrC motif-containing protein [Phycisphaerales bacterium]MCB9860708.1 UvrB/UvrC motif-containing protein [Phycisphaeraceae bacterium]